MRRGRLPPRRVAENHYYALLQANVTQGQCNPPGFCAAGRRRRGPARVHPGLRVVDAVKPATGPRQRVRAPGDAVGQFISDVIKGIQ